MTSIFRGVISVIGLLLILFLVRIGFSTVNAFRWWQFGDFHIAVL